MNAMIVLCFMIYLLLGIASGLPAWQYFTVKCAVDWVNQDHSSGLTHACALRDPV